MVPAFFSSLLGGGLDNFRNFAEILSVARPHYVVHTMFD